MERCPICEGSMYFDTCQDCGLRKHEMSCTPDERRTGGAGARRHPTTDKEYREEMEKLAR